MEEASQNKQPLFKYYIYVVIAGVCWGLTGTLQRLAPETASSLTIGAIRVTGAGFFLLIYTVAREGFSMFRERWDLGGLLIAAFGQIMYQLTFFSAVRLTGVALGTMIAVGASPAMAGFLGRMLFKEPLTRSWYLSTGIAVAGCSLLILGGSAGELSADFLGCLLALAAAFSYTFMGLGLRKIGDHGAAQTITLVFSLSGLLGLPILALSDTSWMLSLRGIGVILALVIAATILPMALFSISVHKIPFSRAYTLSLTEPLTASLLAVCFLGEKVTLSWMLGAVLLFSSICLLTRSLR